MTGNDKEDPLTDFADICERLDLFTRRYDDGHKKLFEAAKILWEHLCTLDDYHRKKAAKIPLAEFADFYILTFKGGEGHRKHSEKHGGE